MSTALFGLDVASEMELQELRADLQKVLAHAEEIVEHVDIELSGKVKEALVAARDAASKADLRETTERLREVSLHVESMERRMNMGGDAGPRALQAVSALNKRVVALEKQIVDIGMQRQGPCVIS